MIKTLFLDADDTIFDFDKAQYNALKQTFEILEYPFDGELYKLYDGINLKYWKLLEKGKTTKEKLVFDRFIEFYALTGIDGDVEKTEENYQSLLGRQAFWLDGAKKGVEYLSGKYDIFVTTNGHGDTQRNRVKLSGLDKFVKGVFISETIGFAKPQKEYYDYCLNASNADTDSVLCIGDSLSSDIKGGINAGLKTMWCNFKNAPTPDMPITYTVRSWEDICEIL